MHRREYWAARPFAAVLLAGTLIGALAALVGLIVGAVVVQAAGAALGATTFPAAIVQLVGGDDGGEDDDDGGGGGGRGRPRDPDVPPYPGLDWDEFDAARREWERSDASHDRASRRPPAPLGSHISTVSSTGTPAM